MTFFSLVWNLYATVSVTIIIESDSADHMGILHSRGNVFFGR